MILNNQIKVLDKILAFTFIIPFIITAQNQNSISSTNVGAITGKLTDLQNGPKPVQTAVPFLTITPNSRAAAMGDQGVATSPDENSAYWNPGKLAFVQKDYGFSTSVNPWLRKLVNDMYLYYLSGYYKIRKEDAIGMNFTYFDLGTIEFTDNNGNKLQDFRPHEFALSASYSRMLSKKFSGGISLKYIYSNLSGNISNSAESQVSPGQTGAADIGFYYNTPLYFADRNFHLAIGTSITNIGGKITYSNNDRQDFIPTVIRLGTVFTAELDDFNKIGLGIEASKLMVPSSEVKFQYYQSTKNPGTDSVDASGKKVAKNVLLYSSTKPLIPGMLGSFNDAPFGAREEMQEIMWSFSAEYWYDNMLALRTGYFYEDPNKGSRQYISFGLGFKYNVVGLDASYLVSTIRNNPLSETFRFSLSFLFDKPKQKEEESAVD
ncbi:MAG: type IX secretion system outer membrane channel protein PorV [Bacteroidota bacterium]|nr:type IX secretion system outer membrane channel protein PorV [Bacteroidota bacterium]